MVSIKFTTIYSFQVYCKKNIYIHTYSHIYGSNLATCINSMMVRVTIPTVTVVWNTTVINNTWVKKMKYLWTLVMYSNLNVKQGLKILGAYCSFRIMNQCTEHIYQLPKIMRRDVGCHANLQMITHILSIKNTLLLTKKFFFSWGGHESSPQSQKHHSTIQLEAEQEGRMVLFVNYQSLEQSQPANGWSIWYKITLMMKTGSLQITMYGMALTVSCSRSANNIASVSACKNKPEIHEYPQKCLFSLQ